MLWGFVGFVLLPLIFGIIWLQHFPHDLQDASVPLSISLTFMTIALGTAWSMKSLAARR